MIVIGFVLLALAVAAAIVLIAQNQSAMVEVHALGYNWNLHVYWVFAAGLIVAAVGFFGVAMMRAGTAHAARLHRERRVLVRENARLNDAATTAPVADQRVQPVVAQPAVAEPATYAATDQPASNGAVAYEPDRAPRHGAFWQRTHHA